MHTSMSLYCIVIIILIPVLCIISINLKICSINYSDFGSKNQYDKMWCDQIFCQPRIHIMCSCSKDKINFLRLSVIQWLSLLISSYFKGKINQSHKLYELSTIYKFTIKWIKSLKINGWYFTIVLFKIH